MNEGDNDLLVLKEQKKDFNGLLQFLLSQSIQTRILLGDRLRLGQGNRI